MREAREEVRVKRFVRMFKPHFAALVKSGAKRQTVRPVPARMPKVGDLLDARQWSGRPYGSPQVRLGEFTIRRVLPVSVCESGITLDGVDLPLQLGDSFAREDGFASEAELVCWFREQHGLPFLGIAIFWTLQAPGKEGV